MTAQIINFPVIPIKPADRVQVSTTYHCTQCGERMTWPWRVTHAVYCEHDGAEMRPVEAK